MVKSYQWWNAVEATICLAISWLGFALCRNGKYVCGEQPKIVNLQHKSTAAQPFPQGASRPVLEPDIIHRYDNPGRIGRTLSYSGH